LKSAGFEVHAPTLTGCGDRAHLLTRDVSLDTHVADVTSLLFHEDLRDVVLVGHSYGGTVVTMVAEQMPERLRRVVFLDASAPVDGQNATGAFAAASAVALDPSGPEDSWLAAPIPCAAIGLAGDDAAWVDARRHSHPLRTLQQPARLTGKGDSVPRSYVRCTRHEGLVAAFGIDPLTPFVDRAGREGWPLTAIDAPHAAPIAAPTLVGDALLAHSR
jgi:pimeloyl-ACP methyl ester carboxylesterase